MLFFILFFIGNTPKVFAEDTIKSEIVLDSLIRDSILQPILALDSIINEKDSLEIDTLLFQEKSSELGNIIQKTNAKNDLVRKPEKKKKELDPEQIFARKAAKWAMLPGGGQIYNKKWWKVPIAWSMIGAGIYFIYNSASNMSIYNQALDMRNSGKVDQFDGQLSEAQIIAYRNHYRRNLHLSAFGTVGLWTLTVLDAVVDAHLKTYDISDDLSIKFKPKVLRVYNNSVPSLAITLYL